MVACLTNITCSVVSLSQRFGCRRAFFHFPFTAQFFRKSHAVIGQLQEEENYVYDTLAAHFRIGFSGRIHPEHASLSYEVVFFSAAA